MSGRDVERPKCTLCGKEAELRPYGPNGARVCYKCAMKDPETYEKQMIKYLFYEDDYS